RKRGAGESYRRSCAEWPWAGSTTGRSGTERYLAKVRTGAPFVHSRQVGSPLARDAAPYASQGMLSPTVSLRQLAMGSAAQLLAASALHAMPARVVIQDSATVSVRVTRDAAGSVPLEFVVVRAGTRAVQ